MIFLDQAIGNVDDIGGGAIVFPELINHSVRECGAEAEDILDHCSSEGVDTLCVVTYDGEDRIRSLQLLDDFILHPIGVLILVDKDVAKSPVELVSHLRVLSQQSQHIDQQIIEVHSIGPEAPTQIAPIDVIEAGHPA